MYRDNKRVRLFVLTFRRFILNVFLCDRFQFMYGFKVVSEDAVQPTVFKGFRVGNFRDVLRIVNVLNVRRVGS